MNFSITRLDKSISAEIEKKGITLDQQGLSQWLIDKNLISQNETLFHFHDIQPWTRAGGETYTTIFSFLSDRQESKVLVKAIVTSNPEKSLIDWTKRRKLLTDNGIPVSLWFWTGEATIYEPFYPNKVETINDFLKLIEIGYTLDKLRFTTLKFLDDILCDKDGNPFYIDFGFDLGEPSPTIKTTAKEHLIKTYPNLKADIEAFYEANS